jgi:hypothetical protein
MPTLTLPQSGCISDPNKIVRQIGDIIRRLAVSRSRTARPCFWQTYCRWGSAVGDRGGTPAASRDTINLPALHTLRR